MKARLRNLLRPAGRPTFEGRLITRDSVSYRAKLTVGSTSIALDWPELNPGQEIEILLDGIAIKGQPFKTSPPAEITYAEIEQWGPHSPENILWRSEPEHAPAVPKESVLAVVTHDLDYRFWFEDEAIVQQADRAITAAIAAAGHALR